mgnify:CR=1 FL=1
MTIRRILVEKKPDFAVEGQHLYQDLKDNLGLRGLKKVRIINRYDVAGMTDETYSAARHTIFAEPPVDDVYDETMSFAPDETVFAIEFLPGQFDQRADSAMQCIQLLTLAAPPVIRTAKLIVLQGLLTEEQIAAVKAYCINPVEAREASLNKPDSLEMESATPPDVAVLEGFCGLTAAGLEELRQDLGLAMSQADIAFCQEYFSQDERRDPTVTEIRVIDTYWSDHCRHTTFFTHLTDVKIEEGRYTTPIAAAWNRYQEARDTVYGATSRPVTLMDVATIGMKQLRLQGKLADLDQSEEINAASIVVPVDVDGGTEDWLVMFKNETHNHPTEIEPFGGAATCLGGAIRDPLSGRAYVYQAMRVTGSADPRTKVEDTLPGKLPQRKITVGAAQGYSSYGNQIGLATGQVSEVYHPDFVAKRMEVGAVIAAAPKANVIRSQPQPGDVVLLIGGRTGRDGCGGATGSSKEHTVESLETCGAEVQKGNAPTERKIQRLYRNPEAARLIKKCNDFGAGGVAVAIGELTDGLVINLDAVPKKYEGLDGTELAISESQERMAAVVAAVDVETFCTFADEENLEVTPVAVVTGDQRLIMNWRGQAIVSLSRDFLNTNGVQQQAEATVAVPDEGKDYFSLLPPGQQKGSSLRQAWLDNLQDLNHCSQRGLAERFDSTIGAATVLMPYGGIHQLTPAEGMAAKIPVLTGETNTATLMSYGYNPYLAHWSPFHGALYAVIESVTKIAAMGGDWQRTRLTFQEYFEKLGTNPGKWGKPLSALLGALTAQQQLGLAAIGGKDSMSGTFMDIHVPPTLVSFAVAPTEADTVISPEFKDAGSPVVLLPLPRDGEEMPCFDTLKQNLTTVRKLAQTGSIRAAQTVRSGGVAAGISKMAFGNMIGFDFTRDMSRDELFSPHYGALLIQLPPASDVGALLGETDHVLLGYTTDKEAVTVNGETVDLEQAIAAWQEPLNGIFPDRLEMKGENPAISEYSCSPIRKRDHTFTSPRVLIPVFPGTNCEYDSARVFREAGANVQTLVFRNLTATAAEESLDALAAAISQAQIVMLPGGFSAGDEPDGSGKFIAAVFRSPRIKEAVDNLLGRRDGLMLGICNGFQALIKLGLVPFGEIRPMDEESPTLTYNVIGRHVSSMVQTRVVSTLSPWLAHTQPGDIHTVPVSHGEGRFVAPAAMIEKLIAKGQVAIQYVDGNGQAATAPAFSPNGALYAIEAVTSPDGRVLGKMAHSERIGRQVAKNVPGLKDQGIFAAGVNYFR